MLYHLQKINDITLLKKNLYSEKLQFYVIKLTC